MSLAFGARTGKTGANRLCLLLPVAGLGLVVCAALFFPACQTVAATGEPHLTLVSQPEEIRLGREADAQISAAVGIYADRELSGYLQELGLRLASVSERPDLPWSFKVLDDEVINAFALPGGFIFVTRGILAYCDSEAELAGILGHEIGHITAKHTVIKISRMQLGQLGFGLIKEIIPGLGRFEALAGIGMQLLFLKFSREDELEADELGVRYLIRVQEDPRQLIRVMEMLEGVSRAQGGGSIPEWLSTHPSPGNRQVNLARLIEALDCPAFRPVERELYLKRLDGLVYGENPRQGYGEGSLFFHPELRFRFDFPPQWQIVNQKVAVLGLSPDEQAAVRITLLEQQELKAAGRDFYRQAGVSGPGTQRATINGLPAEIGAFKLNTDQGTLTGEVVFLRHRDRIYQIIGYATAKGWEVQAAAIRVSLASFAELKDPQALSRQPLRLEVVRLRQGTTLRQYYGQRSCPIPLQELALLNRLQPDAPIPPGRLIKWVAATQQ